MRRFFVEPATSCDNKRANAFIARAMFFFFSNRLRDSSVGWSETMLAMSGSEGSKGAWYAEILIPGYTILGAWLMDLK
jgi:hypothetical protein